jgi:predicted nucleic acid-binding protein
MVIADTGFWLALANRNDRHHRAAKASLEALSEGLITTWPVLTETCHLLATRLSVDALDATDLPRVERLIAKYCDLPMDLADASLVVLAERLGHGRILSTDRRDFQSYRWKNHAPFENLLESR